MNLLLDVAVGRTVAEWLRALGHDVVEVREIEPRMPDVDILRLAVQEKRIVITVDKDFGELAIRQGHPHSGIVRLPDVPVSTRKVLLETVLRNYADALLRGALITVGRHRIRIRYP
jgi:predicted nuclease of predicted toxin-antitoxin system